MPPAGGPLSVRPLTMIARKELQNAKIRTARTDWMEYLFWKLDEIITPKVLKTFFILAAAYVAAHVIVALLR